MVRGSNFISGSAVEWNGNSRPTSFVGNSQLTAQISAADIAASGAAPITVSNPSPGGGGSNPLTFCTTDGAGPASGQTLARLGAYYFDGWSGPLTNFHFNGLVNGQFQDRQPLSGWQDNTPCAVEQQLAWAHEFGINFFVFDWYYNTAVNDPGEDLNSALKITHSLANRHGMQFALLYVNSNPFIIGPADWSSAIREWIAYMQDAAYVLVNGKPYLGIIDMGGMRQTFGSSSAVANALNQVRAAAQAVGLSGVYIVGGLAVPDGISGQDGLFPDMSVALADGYDAVSMYNYPFVAPAVNGMLPFSTLSDAGKWIWNQGALDSPLPFIPVATDGWDPRPWDEHEGLTNDLMWYSRSPGEVATLVSNAIAWAASIPQLRSEPSPAPPIVLTEAWNELGEGSYLVPTIGDGKTYGNALSTMLAAPPAGARTVLTLVDSGSSDPNRQATGTLTDADGSSISGASIKLVSSPFADTYMQYPLSAQVPAGATQAVVGFRVNYEGAGPESSDFSLYQVSYIENADGVNRVANSDFSAGAQSWSLGGQAQLVASDRGSGQMVTVQATPSQTAALTSFPFGVTAGEAFQLSFSARVAPLSLGSGYFTVIFLTSGTESARYRIPLVPATVALGTATTGSAGNYQFSLASLGTSQVVLQAIYGGDSQHWPAYARVTP